MIKHKSLTQLIGTAGFVASYGFTSNPDSRGPACRARYSRPDNSQRSRETARCFANLNRSCVMSPVMTLISKSSFVPTNRNARGDIEGFTPVAEGWRINVNRQQGNPIWLANSRFKANDHRMCTEPTKISCLRRQEEVGHFTLIFISMAVGASR